MNSYDGYTIYGIANNKRKPIGFVNNNGERKSFCSEIPLFLKNALIEIEDKRFLYHKAIDFKAICRAIYQNIKAFRIVQGGSTISQQLSKNILRDNRRSLSRKINELKLSIKLERSLSKGQILDLYFNEVFWGRKNYGLRAASITYFYKEPKYLSLSEQIALLTLLRGPNLYLTNNTLFKNRLLLIINKLYTSKVIKDAKKFQSINKEVRAIDRFIPTFKESTIQYIANNINKETFTISTTIQKSIQDICVEFVNNSKFPVSILCLKKVKIVGTYSTYGTSHPFEYKSNVGSTLKPFLYVFLRLNGFNSESPIPNISLTNWEVREINDNFKNTCLKNALRNSTNNAFVNASYIIGIEKTLSFLAKTLNINNDDLFPSSILGATRKGISLFELALAYHNFFIEDSSESDIKEECKEILHNISIEKLNTSFEGLFLKSGTTNDNKDQIIVATREDFVYAFSRGEITKEDYFKESPSFNSFIKNFLNKVYSPKKKRNYSFLNQ